MNVVLILSHGSHSFAELVRIRGGSTPWAIQFVVRCMVHVIPYEFIFNLV
jgi:hypothetical protein